MAVIPARGGSKRIPRKNIRLFCGKPMIAWSIEAARRSNCFDQIIVSTDDPEIAAVARDCGAETPFLRPAELADDYTPTIPVMAHAIDWMGRHGEPASAVCCIYATAPFLRPEDLRHGLALLEAESVDYAFAVTSYGYPIQRAIRITSANRVAMIHPEHVGARSQDLEPAYHDAGQFYWGRASAWIAGAAIFSNQTVPVMLPRHRVQDIDTLDDWERAELMFAALRQQSEQL